MLSIGTLQYKRKNYKITIIISFIVGILFTLFGLLVLLTYNHTPKVDVEREKKEYIILVTNNYERSFKNISRDIGL